VSLFSQWGQILIIASFFIKTNDTVKLWVKASGILLLFVGYFYLSYAYLFQDAHNDFAAQIGFYSGLPFAMLAIFLLMLMFKIE